LFICCLHWFVCNLQKAEQSVVVETHTAPRNREEVKVIILVAVVIIIIVQWLLLVGWLVGHVDWF